MKRAVSWNIGVSEVQSGLNAAIEAGESFVHGAHIASARSDESALTARVRFMRADAANASR